MIVTLFAGFYYAVVNDVESDLQGLGYASVVSTVASGMIAFRVFLYI